MELIYKVHLKFIIVMMNFLSILISMIANAARITIKIKISGGILEGAIILVRTQSSDKQWHYIIKKSKLLTQNIFCLLRVKFLKTFLFLYIAVNFDFEIDSKSANFHFKNPQNISVDQIVTEFSTFSFHYELVMNFSWNPKDS